MRTLRTPGLAIATLVAVALASGAEGQRQRRGRVVVIASGEHVDAHGRDEWEAIELRTRLPRGRRQQGDMNAAEYEAIAAAMRAYARTYGWLPSRRLDLPMRYPIYPHGGKHEGDMYFSNFVDLDPAADDVLDWDCSAYTYDSHAGIDSSPRSFGYQDAGIPVFAAMDGRVIDAQDGNFDRHKEWDSSAKANRVVIDHGDQQTSIYSHLRKDSVAVQVGDDVVAGQQIAEMGSSGISTNTHLHFETNVDDKVMEPFAGSCRAGKSGFTKQLKFKRKLYIIDAGITHVEIRDLPDSQQYPEQLPGSGQFAMDSSVMNHWILVRNMPANSTWRLIFRRPDGGVARDTGDQPFNNSSFARRWTTRFRSFADGMDEIEGTWELEYHLNGKRRAVLPYEVVDAVDEDLNRAPERLRKVKFHRKPKAGTVPFCEVKHDLVNDDPDYTVVSYEYVWKVNGEIVRQVTSAAHTDALAVDLFDKGDQIECTVTPTDGELQAASKTVTAKAR